MDRTFSKRCALLGAALGLLRCGITWADEPPPRPDAIADHQQRPQILVLAKKHSLPGPIEIPRPIVDVKPVGEGPIDCTISLHTWPTHQA